MTVRSLSPVDRNYLIMYTCLKAKSATQITIVLKSIQILILVQFFAYLMTALAILLSEYSIHTTDFEKKRKKYQ